MMTDDIETPSQRDRYIVAIVIARQVEELVELFEWQHLPDHLQAASKPFGEQATSVIAAGNWTFETVYQLRRMLEAKDAAVRCWVARHAEGLDLEGN